MTNYASSIIDDVDAQMPGALPDDLLRLYALLALIKGRATTLADVHDAWAIWRQVTDPNHRSLLPFAELSGDVQELDRPYMDAIHRAAPAAELTPEHRHAERIILSHAQDVEFLTIAEMLDDDADQAEPLSEAEFDQLCRRVDDLISTATVTVTWPQDAEQAGGDA